LRKVSSISQSQRRTSIPQRRHKGSSLSVAGDLTTNNVLLIEHEEDLARPFSVKVSDFGLSRVHASESAISTNTFGTVRCRTFLVVTLQPQHVVRQDLLSGVRCNLCQVGADMCLAYIETQTDICGATRVAWRRRIHGFRLWW